MNDPFRRQQRVRVVSTVLQWSAIVLIAIFFLWPKYNPISKPKDPVVEKYKKEQTDLLLKEFDFMKKMADSESKRDRTAYMAIVKEYRENKLELKTNESNLEAYLDKQITESSEHPDDLPWFTAAEKLEMLSEMSGIPLSTIVAIKTDIEIMFEEDYRESYREEFEDEGIDRYDDYQDGRY